MTGKYYEAFLEDPAAVAEGAEMRLFIRDLTPGPQKYDALFVRVRILGLAEPGGDTLRLRYLDGRPYPRTLGIKILKDLGEYVKAAPYGTHTGIFPEE